MAKKITKVLIANRGEIARRIRRAADALGIQSVMLASEADKDSYHLENAKEVAFLNGSAANETYLDGKKIVSLAKHHGCDALHPGYGFLSENGDFAKLVEDAGITFIGPRSETIYLMGDKQKAKEVASEAGVPFATSLSIESEPLNIKNLESTVGYPMLLKAAAGGGGRGMRIVREKKSLADEVKRAKAEALKFFSDERVFAETFIELPRHVEVQVFGDSAGGAVHFGTRDCSVQRRHQKLIEEAPAPFLEDETREKLHAYAVNLVKQVGYRGAGTVEFLVKNGDIYFLEMNTRIQVEHPVTEEAYGVDLVALQFHVAEGSPIGPELKELEPKKHSIEYRVYAEDPANEFSPTLGKITSLTSPSPRDWFREDSGVQAGDTISPFYDAMLTKLIVNGETRGSALEKSRYILKNYTVSGLASTIPFHLWMLHCTPFTESPVDIGYVGREFSKEKLKEIEPLLVLDPAHKSYGDDNRYLETVSIHHPKNGGEVPIEIIHRTDGLFLARLREDSHDLKKARISNTREQALRSIKESLARTHC